MESWISIDGGEEVLLSSLTPEEKMAAWERIGERIGRVIENYIRQHPEQYERIRQALLDSGAEIIKVERI